MYTKVPSRGVRWHGRSAWRRYTTYERYETLQHNSNLANVYLQHVRPRLQPPTAIKCSYLEYTVMLLHIILYTLRV